MIIVNTPLNVTFTVLNSDGTDYSSGAAPTVTLIYPDGTHAASTNAATFVASSVWSVTLTNSEVSQSSVTIAWSGTGIISGSKQIVVETSYGLPGTSNGIATKSEVGTFQIVASTPNTFNITAGNG